MSSKNDTSLTPTGTPTVNQTKRLSTIKAPGSPKTLKTGGAGVKDVVSPGELCGFVRTLPFIDPVYVLAPIVGARTLFDSELAEFRAVLGCELTIG